MDGEPSLEKWANDFTATVGQVMETYPPAACFVAGGKEDVCMGFSTGVSEPNLEDDIELLAYHFFETATKHDIGGKDLARKMVARYNEEREYWSEWSEGGYR